MHQFDFLDHPGPIPFAHRGGKGDWPENSWTAFENAIALGFRYIETDVRSTKDGVALIFHDEDLKRVAGRDGSIRSTNYREAARLTVGDGKTIPRLDDVFDRWPSLRLNIDIKHPSALEPTVEAIKRTRALKRVCITSFRDSTILGARRHLGRELCIGGGVATVSFVRVGSIAFPTLRVHNSWLNRNVIQVPEDFHNIPICDRKFMEYAKLLRLPVHVWTVNDTESMERLLAMGAQGIITDYPQTLKDLLTRRGEWYS